ncbi:MAG TPA: hypothetical protein VFN35_19410, partial [Ktedonobacteraceae bacterium]|nr:hypothetical protein [Ktedonobacteraceae bacterium]
KELLSPQGIGVAVAIDWGLAVQIFLAPFLSILLNQSSLPFRQTTLSHSPIGTIISFGLGWLAAGILVFFGEMVRSGRNWARIVQIVASVVLVLGGLFMLGHAYQSIRMGNFWPIVPEVILLVFTPLVAWRLSRRRTARWFQAISPAQARERHGGSWVWFIALWALIGGVLQTIASMK